MQVREQGNSRLGTKVEVKNMNSFSAMQRAIDFEINRQVVLKGGFVGHKLGLVRVTNLSGQACVMLCAPT